MGLQTQAQLWYVSWSFGDPDECESLRNVVRSKPGFSALLAAEQRKHRQKQPRSPHSTIRCGALLRITRILILPVQVCILLSPGVEKPRQRRTGIALSHTVGFPRVWNSLVLGIQPSGGLLREDVTMLPPCHGLLFLPSSPGSVYCLFCQKHYLKSIRTSLPVWLSSCPHNQ